jgi:Predicted methyltransferase regulatory domain
VGRRLEEAGPTYAFHEYLAEEHHPQLVGAFLRKAAAAGLAYVGDAIPSTVALELLPDEARERAGSLGVADAQQLVDFVRCTTFRRALLVRAGDGARAALDSKLDPRAIRSFFVSSRLRSQEAASAEARQESFAEGEWVVQVANAAARRALHELARAAPGSLAFGELARRSLGSGATEDASSTLALELFDVWLATGGLDFRVDAPAIVSSPDDRPTACLLARWHARHGGTVTSRLHQEVLVPDAIVRWVLARLDGTRTASRSP